MILADRFFELGEDHLKALHCDIIIAALLTDMYDRKVASSLMKT